MSENSPRPWKLGFDGIFDADIKRVLEIAIYEREVAEYIVKCVNEYDALVAEVEQLKSTISLLQYGKYGTGHYASIAADERQRAEKA